MKKIKLSILVLIASGLICSCGEVDDDDKKHVGDGCGVADTAQLIDIFQEQGFELEFAKARKSSSPITGEQTLHLDKSIINPPEGITQILQCRSDVTINNQSMEFLAAKIRLSAIETFRGEATGIAANPCDNMITAMRIFYGISGTTFTLYFRPVKLCKVSEAGTEDGYVMYNYNLHEDASVLFGYNENTEAFTPLTEAALTAARSHTLEYANTSGSLLRIRTKNGDLNLSPFVNATNESGSVKSTLLPFQKINFFAGEYLYLYNAIKRVPFQGHQYNKHILLLSSATIVNEGNVSAPAASFGDMTHLCPPSCDANHNYSFAIE